MVLFSPLTAPLPFYLCVCACVCVCVSPVSYSPPAHTPEGIDLQTKIQGHGTKYQAITLRVHMYTAKLFFFFNIYIWQEKRCGSLFWCIFNVSLLKVDIKICKTVVCWNSCHHCPAVQLKAWVCFKVLKVAALGKASTFWISFLTFFSWSQRWLGYL